MGRGVNHFHDRSLDGLTLMESVVNEARLFLSGEQVGAFLGVCFSATPHILSES